MTLLEALALGAAGAAAGTMNTVVGSGSVVTFPALLAFGYPPVLANVTNSIGIFPGSLSGVIGYRAELRGAVRRAVWLGLLSACGATVGALLLLTLPASAFDAIVPALILLAVVLSVVQPRISRWLARRPRGDLRGGPLLAVGVLLVAVYGGYFGAAQGVLLIVQLTILVDDDLHRLNSLKNVLAAVANGVAGLVFVLTTEVAWDAAAALAAGGIIGGQLGARAGRRLPVPVYRAAIVAVGSAAVVTLLLRS